MTLGASATPDHPGCGLLNFVLDHQPWLGFFFSFSFPESSFPNCISTFQSSDVSGCSWVFFFFFSRETRVNLVSPLKKKKRPPNTICRQLNCLPSILSAGIKTKHPPTRLRPFTNTQSGQLAVWANQENVSKCFLCSCTTSTALLNCLCHCLFGIFCGHQIRINVAFLVRIKAEKNSFVPL